MDAGSPSSSSQEALIKIRNLWNVFGAHIVHENLNLDIYRGETLAIVGGSGSGKTTLLHSIVGLHTFTSGEITLFGKESQSLSSRERSEMSRKWGFMFQEGALWSNLTVIENIMFPMIETLHLPKEIAQDLALLKLQLAGLETTIAHQNPASLSGGMRKRVGIARALSNDPEVLFLDEPTAGLDPIRASDFDRLICNLNQNLGLTIVIITHDLNTIKATADRIAVIENKQIIADTLENLLHNPNPTIQAYFTNIRAKEIFGRFS